MSATSPPGPADGRPEEKLRDGRQWGSDLLSYFPIGDSALPAFAPLPPASGGSSGYLAARVF